MNLTTNCVKLGTGEYLSMCDACITAFGLTFDERGYPSGPLEYTRGGNYIDERPCHTCPDSYLLLGLFRTARAMLDTLREDEPRVTLAYVYRALCTWYRVACDNLLEDAFDYIYGSWPNTIAASHFTNELDRLVAEVQVETTGE